MAPAAASPSTRPGSTSSGTVSSTSSAAASTSGGASTGVPGSSAVDPATGRVARPPTPPRPGGRPGPAPRPARPRPGRRRRRRRTAARGGRRPRGRRSQMSFQSFRGTGRRPAYGVPRMGDRSAAWRGRRGARRPSARSTASGGFFRRPDSAPSQHFRTSVHASPLFAEAVRRLARDAGLTTVVDVGAGGGELLAALHARDPSLDLVGVDLADRPPDLPADVGVAARDPRDAPGHCWSPTSGSTTCRSTSSSWPTTGWRLVLVDPATGAERLGPPPADDDADWLATVVAGAGDVGDRAEVGRPRDEAWAAAVGSLTDGLAVAIDYAHDRTSRPPAGSLTGYRDGRQVPPVPDGSCDVTSHVALDACAAAGHRAPARPRRCSPPSARRCTALGVRRDRRRRTSCPAPTRPATCGRCRGPARRPSSPTRAGSAASAGWCRRGPQTGTARRSSAADCASQRRWRRVTIRAGG